MKKHITYILLSWFVTLATLAVLFYFSGSWYAKDSSFNESALVPYSMLVLGGGGGTALFLTSISIYTILVQTEMSRGKKMLLIVSVFPCLLISCTLSYAAILFLTGS